MDSSTTTDETRIEAFSFATARIIGEMEAANKCGLIGVVLIELAKSGKTTAETTLGEWQAALDAVRTRLRAAHAVVGRPH